MYSLSGTLSVGTLSGTLLLLYLLKILVQIPHFIKGSKCNVSVDGLK